MFFNPLGLSLAVGGSVLLGNLNDFFFLFAKYGIGIKKIESTYL